MHKKDQIVQNLIDIWD